MQNALISSSYGRFRQKLNSTLLSEASYTPLSLLNGRLWLKFNDISTLWTDSSRTTPVTSDGDGIGYVDNKYGVSTYDFKQGTTARRPTYKTNQINGKATAFFSTDDVLECLSAFNWTNGGFVWLVTKPSLHTATYQRIYSARTNLDSDFNQDNSVIVVRAGDATSGNPFLVQTNSLQADPMVLLSSTVTDSTSYYLRSYFTAGNGSLTVTGQTVVTDTYTNINAVPFWQTMGAQRIALPAYQEFYEGYVAEFGVAVGVQTPSNLAAHDAYILSEYVLA